MYVCVCVCVYECACVCVWCVVGGYHRRESFSLGRKEARRIRRFGKGRRSESETLDFFFFFFFIYSLI